MKVKSDLGLCNDHMADLPLLIDGWCQQDMNVTSYSSVSSDSGDIAHWQHDLGEQP